MSISVNTNENGLHTIKIVGKFDFTLHREFRDAYADAPAIVNSYELNMRSTTYMDSSALGMLLLLRDYAGGDNSSVIITHASPEIKKILEVSNFRRLLDIT